MQLTQLCERYLTHLRLERAVSPNTVEGYQRDLSALCAALAQREVVAVEAVTSDHLADYFHAMASRGAAASTQRRAVSSVRQLFLYGQRQHCCGRSPARSLAPPKVARSLPKVPTVDEAVRLLEHVAQDVSPRGLRDRCALELLYSCGLRASELCALRIVDVCLADGLVRLPSGAGRRSVPMGRAAQSALVDYLERGRPALCKAARHEILIVGNAGQPMTRMALFALVRRRGAAAGLTTTLSPHTFRHAFALHLIDNGADLRAVQQMLGLKHIAATEIYVQAGPARLRDTIDAHHPLSSGSDPVVRARSGEAPRSAAARGALPPTSPAGQR